jgi:hypothetical protein
MQKVSWLSWHFFFVSKKRSVSVFSSKFKFPSVSSQQFFIGEWVKYVFRHSTI